MSRKAYNPLPGTRDDPSLYESTDLMFMTRHDGLADVSDRALKELTSLLNMPPFVNIEKPGEEWLQAQKELIPKLNSSIRVPPNFLARLALRVNRYHRLPFFPQVAKLCWAHKGLDPRVIRNLTLLVGHECTLRTDRFRAYRGLITFPNSVAVWLDRMDSVTAMWIGEFAFRKVFGYKAKMPAYHTVQSGCEACIMAVVGGRRQLLCDLRASMLARKARYHDKKYKGGKHPRLLRIVDAWIARFDKEEGQATLEESNMLAKDISDVYQEMSRRKKKKEKERVEKGQSPTPRGRRHRRHSHDHGHRRAPMPFPKDDLPSPTQPTRGRYDRRASLPDYSDATLCDKHKVPAAFQKENNKDVDNSKDSETWDWLLNKTQGLTPEERAEVFSDVHPAFSNFQTAFSSFQNKSAVPEPLHSGAQNPYKGVKTVEERDDEDIWEAVTVHTIGSEPAVDEPAPTIPRISQLLQDRHSRQPGSSRRIYPITGSEDEDEDGAYVPPRRNWNPVDAAQNPFVKKPPGPPPSSIYSDHSGFPTNHRVTEHRAPQNDRYRPDYSRTGRELRERRVGKGKEKEKEKEKAKTEAKSVVSGHSAATVWPGVREDSSTWTWNAS